jgi:hypothetical protein
MIARCQTLPMKMLLSVIDISENHGNGIGLAGLENVSEDVERRAY